MKRCPECRRDYTDETLNFCLEDGAVLQHVREDLPTMFFGYQDSSISSPNQPTKERSVAVLPFSSVSADRENEYFSDGLAEELLSSLARIDGLKVASRTSAFSFKGKDAKIGDIAAALGVNFVLEGSVRRSGERLRINVQLVKAAEDRQVWSERYDREMKDIFDVQDEIALAVIDALKLKLLGSQRAALLKRYTNNPEAHELFLKGRFHWYKHTPEDVRRSREYFQRAIDIDPEYAPGHAGLAEYYGISSALGMMDPAKGWPLSETAMKRAQELDDELPEVHNGLAAVRGIYYRDPNGAEQELRQALGLNSRFSEAHSLYSFILAGQGRLDEAIDEATAALSLDPLSLSYRRYLGWWFYFARRFGIAIERYRQIIEEQPTAPQLHADLRDALEQLGRKDEAVEAWKAEAVITGDSELVSALDSGSNADGAMAEAAKLELARLNLRLTMGEWVPPTQFARCYIRLDQREKALSWLEKAAEVRDCFSLLLTVDPFFDPVRNDPRFSEIVSRIKGKN